MLYKEPALKHDRRVLESPPALIAALRASISVAVTVPRLVRREPFPSVVDYPT